MYSIEIIKPQINNSVLHNLQINFVGAAVKFDDSNETINHSGIVICLEEKLYIFHFDSIETRLDPLEGKWYFDKKFEFIFPEDVPAFYSYCQRIKEKSSPKYGFNYNGSFFRDNGEYFSNVKDYEFMTCVGFCLNVITGFIESNLYIQYEDWSIPSGERDWYFQEKWENYEDIIPQEERKNIKDKQRRIYPIEFISTSFLNSYPISKDSIDLIKPYVSDSIKGIIKELKELS